MNNWSNDACRGYCIDAMQRAGIDKEQIANVLDYLFISFDTLTEEEAEQKFYQF